MARKLGALLIVLLAASIVRAQSHPYIWLTPTVLSSIDAKAAASDPNWVALKAQADTYLTYTVPAFDRNACTSTEICYTYEGGGWYNAITTLGLAYQVTGNTAYANQVIAIMQAATATYTNVGTLTVNASNDLEVTASNWTFTSNDQYIYISGGTGWTPGWYSVSSISGSSAILATSPAAVGTTGGVWHDVQPISVDQGYPSRYAALGLAIGFDWVYSQLTSQEKTDTINTLNLWYDWYKLYAYEKSGPATGNYFTGHLLGFGAAGYATAGDNSRSSEIEAYIENLFTTVVDPSISSGELQGGYPIESYNYGPNNFERTLQYMQIVKDNSSTDLGIVAFGEKMANSLIYNLKPNLWEASDEGDYPGTYTGVMPSNLPLIVAYETSGTTQGAWMQYMGNNFATPPDGGISIQTALPLEYLFYANSSRTATSYSGQPTFYASPGDAHFYGLSGWASTSIWSSFAGGSTVWGDHQMHGAGHIAIQRGSDYLLVNNGQWKGTDGISGSPTIDDSLNSWRTNTLYFNDGSSLTDGDQYVGGQGYWGTTDLLASGIGTNYLYAKSNLVSAYPNGPNYPYNGNSTLLTFVRSYVFLGDHYWVVWDRATDALSTYTMNLFWHFNLNGEPTISGNTLTSTTGSSVLYVTTLLPSGASISVAGDGVASFTDSTISTYRGIIANSVSGTTLNVLTVMDADASGTSEPTVSSITVGSGNMVGAQIADATPRAVLFSSDGTAQTSVTYSTTYSGTGRNVVADLSPGTYKAVVNGSTVASGLSVASGNGTLTFTSGSGTVLISQQVNAGTQLSGVASGVIQ